MKALFVPLATEPYRRFEAGTKTVEVRQYGPRWHIRTVQRGREVVLSRGYSTPDRLRGVVMRVVVVPSVRDLPAWAKEGADLRDVQLHPLRGRVFFDPDRPVLAFEVGNIRPWGA